MPEVRHLHSAVCGPRRLDGIAFPLREYYDVIYERRCELFAETRGRRDSCRQGTVSAVTDVRQLIFIFT